MRGGKKKRHLKARARKSPRRAFGAEDPVVHLPLRWIFDYTHVSVEARAGAPPARSLRPALGRADPSWCVSAHCGEPLPGPPGASRRDRLPPAPFGFAPVTQVAQGPRGLKHPWPSRAREVFYDGKNDFHICPATEDRGCADQYNIFETLLHVGPRRD